MKRFLHWVLPPILPALGSVISGSFKRRNIELGKLENEYKVLNSNSELDTIVLRPGLSLRAHPDSIKSFQYFCFNNLRAKQELDSFIELSKTKKCLLDIGALHGIFSLVFAGQDPANRAIALDPSPIAFSKLLYNINKNQFENIQPIECAVSDRPGHLSMSYEWEHLVASPQALLKIQAKTGDDICNAQNFNPDIIKIDVEGHEIKVLQGLSETLKNHKPTIFLEFHPSRIREGGDDPRFLAELCEELEYHVTKVDGQYFPLADFSSSLKDENLILASFTSQ